MKRLLVVAVAAAGVAIVYPAVATRARRLHERCRAAMHGDCCPANA
jgi:hypothetical protein